MKKMNRLSFVAVLFSALMVFTFSPSGGYSQGKTKEQTLAQFPQPVSGVFANSCVGCHNDMSQGKAKEFMNFSSWDKLTLKDQKKTSKEIAKVVRKGIMPPADVVEKYPQAALKPEQAQTIKEWASSVKKGK
jgi:hypothetical protein